MIRRILAWSCSFCGIAGHGAVLDLRPRRVLRSSIRHVPGDLVRQADVHQQTGRQRTSTPGEFVHAHRGTGQGIRDREVQPAPEVNDPLTASAIYSLSIRDRCTAATRSAGRAAALARTRNYNPNDHRRFCRSVSYMAHGRRSNGNASFHWRRTMALIGSS